MRSPPPNHIYIVFLFPVPRVITRYLYDMTLIIIVCDSFVLVRMFRAVNAYKKVLKNEHNGLSYYFTWPFKATRHLCLENTIFTFSYFVTIRTYNVSDFSSYESKICIRDIQLKGRYGGVWWTVVQFNTIQGRYRIVTYSGIGFF